LNANAFDSWDAKRSVFRRVDGYENAVQQGGVVPQGGSPDVSPTPTPTITQTQTQTSTPTPSITPTFTPTPSSTPYPLPLNPTLWYDATDSSTLTLINSGGTNYVSSWQSKGTTTWSLSGTNTDTMPVLSASTLMPGNPSCVRFTQNATTTSRDALQSFNNTPIGHTGSTIFQVWAKPLGSNYTTSPSTIRIYSGLTNGSLAINNPIQQTAMDSQLLNITAAIQSQQIYGTIPSGFSISNFSVPSYSAAGLNDKYIFQTRTPFTAGQFATWELNQSAGTNTTVFTGTTTTPQINSFTIGITTITTGGTINYTNMGVELCEVMYYDTVLTDSQVEQVELYLKDKWRYDEWASPVPTPTPTASNTPTLTQTITPTNTATPTNTPTPSATPPPFNPSSLSPDIWVDFSDSSSMTIRTSGSNSFLERINNKGTDVALTAYTQTTAGNQPQIKVSTVFTGLTISAATVSNDWLSGVATLSGFSWTIVYVIGRKLGDGTPQMQPSRFTWGGSAYSPYWMDTSTNTVLRQFVSVPASYTVSNPNTLTYTGQTYLQYLSTTGASATAYIEMNATGLTITQSGYHQNIFPAATSWLLNEDGTVGAKNGEVGEIIMLRRELTSTEKTNLYNYLKTKWGLTY
jgi:hypothetical protein